MRKLARAGTAGALAVASTATALSLVAAARGDSPTFAGGDLVVYRVGDGATALSNAGAPVFLDRLHADGSLAKSYAVPTSTTGDQRRLTSVGFSTSEGRLTRSPDGHWLAFTGYDAAPGAFGPAGSPQSLAASTATQVPRVVGLLDGNGTLDTSTVLASAGAPQITRAAATLTADRALVAGSTGGVRAKYIASAVADAQVAGPDTLNLDALQLQGGRLFASVSGGTIDAIGNGASFASGATATALPGLPDHLLTGGFAFLDLDGASYAGTGLDTLYVADQSAKSGTVDKFRFDGTNWTAAGSVALPGVDGLVAVANAGVVSLAVSTSSNVQILTDTAGTATSFTPSGPTTIATAPAGTAYRGLALAPTAPAGPTAFLRTPDVASTVSGAATALSVAVDVASPQGISSVTARIDSAATKTLSHGSGTRWTASLPLTAFATGTHTLRVVATDASSAHGKTTITRTFRIAPLNAPTGDLGPGTYSFLAKYVKHSSTWSKALFSGAPGRYGIKTTGKGSVTLTYYGRRLVLYVGGRKNAGKVKVTDNGKTKTIDLYRSTSKSLVLSFGPHTLGAHKVTIAAPKSKNSSSRGFLVLLGYLVVTK